MKSLHNTCRLNFVPKSASGYTGETAILINGDLREKYGMGPLQSVDDLEAYYYAVAENEQGIFPIVASQRSAVKGVTYYAPNNLVELYEMFIYKYDEQDFKSIMWNIYFLWMNMWNMQRG